MRCPTGRTNSEHLFQLFTRYISTAVADLEIDLAGAHEELVKVESSINMATEKHNEFLSELGLARLP